jgi:hypothetical protein
MSTTPSSAPQPAAASGQQPIREVRIYGHTALFYWWPVWVIGYIMSLITLANDDRSLIVSKNFVQVDHLASGEIKVSKSGGEEIKGDYKLEYMHKSKNLGVVFAIVLLLVIVITNVHLRGLSSAIAIVLILLFTVLFAWLGVWDNILTALGRLSIHMNLGFYLFFSTALFIAWLLTFILYDRLSYWRVTPGQITHDYVFGGGEKAYDTEGMAFEKLRDDLFRHWVLGFGSGDLRMFPLSAAPMGSRDEFHMHNVLFVGAKLRRIQDMIAQKPDTSTR